MIIDLILDRRDYEKDIRAGYDSVQYPNGEIVSILYDPKKFYNSIVRYGKTGENIARALDSGAEEDVKKALCDYIDNNDYNPGIKRYINSRDWLTPDTMDSVLDEIDIMSSKRTGRKTIMSATPTYDSRMDDRFDAEIPDEFEIYDRIGKAYCKVADYKMIGTNAALVTIGVLSYDTYFGADEYIERGLEEFFGDMFNGSDYYFVVDEIFSGLPKYMDEYDIIGDADYSESYKTFTVNVKITSSEHDDFADDSYFSASRKIGKKRPVTASKVHKIRRKPMR